MRDITIILAYYMNPRMLARQYHSLAILPAPLRKFVKLIVVDDGSPEKPAIAVPRLRGLDLSIYRIKVDVRWNQDAARNLGVHHAVTRWIALTDVDHLFPQETIEKIIFGKLDSRSVYRFARVNDPDLSPYKPHPNSWLMTRKVWECTGGYDERFAGFYGTDGDFQRRVERCAEFLVQMKEPLIRVPREVTPDASTTAYTRKEPFDKPSIKSIAEDRARIPNWRPLRLTFPWERLL